MSRLDSKEISLQFEHSNLETFLYIGIILLVLKIEGDIPEEKDWLERIANWSNMSLFNRFRILIGILLGPPLLSSFKGEMLETSVLSVGVIKNDSIFRVGGNHTFSWKI